jgi:metal-responsive CopG/Arc/MetJ family transcriptional regulator
MKKNRKVKVFFTMDPELHKEFEEFIEKNLLDKSKLIEFIIGEYLDNSKNKNNENNEKDK